MKKKKSRPLDPKARKRTSIIVGIVSLLVLIGAITAAVLLTKKENTADSPSEAEPASSEETVSETNSSAEPEPEQEKGPVVLTADDIPAPTMLFYVDVSPRTDTVFPYLENDRECPYIATVCENRDGQCVALVVHSKEQDGDTTRFGCEYLLVDIPHACFGNAVEKPGDPFTYDKNVDTRLGSFGIEYDQGEKRGPFVLFWEQNGEKKMLLYSEEKDAFARLLRQNDHYLVYSVKNEDITHYYVIDTKGNTVLDLGWDADITVTAPLTFYKDFLLCKTDTNDDYVYDTVTKIDLKTGESTDLVFVGDREHWTYSPDGALIAVYGEEAPTGLVCFSSEALLSGKTYGLHCSEEAPIESIHVIGGCVCGIRSGETKEAFFIYLSEADGALHSFVQKDLSEYAHFAVGCGRFSVADRDILTIYDADLLQKEN